MLHMNAQSAPNSSALPKRFAGIVCAPRRHHLFDGLAALLRRADRGAAHAVGVEHAGQQVVDGHVGRHQLAGCRASPATKPVSPLRAPLDRPSISIGAFTEPEVMLTTRPKPRSAMRVDGGLDQLDRREHVGVDRLDPVVAVPVAEVARRRAAGVVDQDVDLRARGQRGFAAGRGGDVAGDRAHLDLRIQRAQLLCRRLQRLVAARGDDHVHALAHQRRRATLAQPLAGRADQRPLAFDSQIHSFARRHGR